MTTLNDESVWQTAALAPYAATDTVQAAREVQGLAQAIVAQVDANPAAARDDFTAKRGQLDDALRRAKTAHYHDYRPVQRDIQLAILTVGIENAHNAKAKGDALLQALKLAETYAETATDYATNNLEAA